MDSCTYLNLLVILSCSFQSLLSGVVLWVSGSASQWWRYSLEFLKKELIAIPHMESHKCNLWIWHSHLKAFAWPSVTGGAAWLTLVLCSSAAASQPPLETTETSQTQYKWANVCHTAPAPDFLTPRTFSRRHKQQAHFLWSPCQRQGDVSSATEVAARVPGNSLKQILFLLDYLFQNANVT